MPSPRDCEIDMWDGKMTHRSHSTDNPPTPIVARDPWLGLGLEQHIR